MPAKASGADFENAIQAYVAGESCENAAARFHVGQGRLSTELAVRSLFRSRKERYQLAAPKIAETRMEQLGLPDAEIAKRYLAGESENTLADAYGVSRTAIAVRLRHQGITRRTQTEANQLLAEQTPIEEHHRRIKIAQKATRGRKHTMAHRRHIALSRQRRETLTSPAEHLLAKWLRERGASPILQQAVGPYNVDIGLHPIAVEILGGAWHASKPTHPERTRYILNQGWHAIFIWSHIRRSPLQEAVADYIIAALDELRSQPSPSGQYRVIRGDGYELARCQFDVQDFTLIVPGYESLNGSPVDQHIGR